MPITNLVNPVTLLSEHTLGAEEFLAALVESSSEAIIGTSQGRVMSWNAGAERLYGYSAAEMLGREISVLFPLDRREEFSDIRSRLMRGETVLDLHTERLRKDGTLVSVSVTNSPVIGPDGELLGASTIARDMTTQVQATEALRQAERSAAEALSLFETIESSAPIGFSFMDRDLRVVRVNEKAAAINGLSVQEHVGKFLGDVIPSFWRQLEPAYRRVLKSGKPVLNLEVCHETAEEPGRAHSWLESLYPVRVDDQIIGVGAAFIDITERKDAEQAQKALTRAAVDAVSATAEARDPYTTGHQNRVATIASFVAGDLGLDQDTIDGIDLAARIHDIGKIAIPAEILTRSTKLSAPEWELIKTHSRVGADIIRGIAFPWPVADMIEQHHERLDGSGYPDGLRGDAICIGAQIIAVADVVEAMASHRPYRPAQGIEAALEEIEKGKGRLYDPAIADACLRLFRDGILTLEQP
jgi:PAS domain S-box-containing protein/putative nucleotidyltransferase with HDIG domain